MKNSCKCDGLQNWIVWRHMITLLSGSGIKYALLYIPYFSVFCRFVPDNKKNVNFLRCYLVHRLKDPQTWLKHGSNDDYLHSCIYRKVHFVRKNNLSISKNPIFSQYWVTKSKFLPSVSQKPKTKVVFLLCALTLNWRHSWNVCPQEAY